MLVNFGDFIDGKQDKVADPYIQLLSTTEIAEAHSDFVEVRLKGIDSTKDQMFLDTFTPSGPPDVGKPNADNAFSSWLDRHKIILIAVGTSVGGVLLILFAVCFCICRRRKANVREKDGKKLWFRRGVPIGGKSGYKPVHESVPSAESYLPHSGGKV